MTKVTHVAFILKVSEKHQMFDSNKISHKLPPSVFHDTPQTTEGKSFHYSGCSVCVFEDSMAVARALAEGFGSLTPGTAVGTD